MRNMINTAGRAFSHVLRASSRSRRVAAYLPGLESLEDLRLPSTINFPGVQLDGMGRIAQAVIYDQQDGAIQSYGIGKPNPANPATTLPPFYGRVPLGTPGDTIIPVSATLDGTGTVSLAVVYDMQAATFLTYKAGTVSATNPTGTQPTYTSVQLGYKGDTIVPLSVTLDATNKITQAIIYDEQDGAIQAYTAGRVNPTYARLPIGYKGDTVIPLFATLNTTGTIIAQAIVYDEQDASVQTYKAGTAQPGTLGGTQSFYTRVSLGYAGDTVIPLSATLDGTGNLMQAAVYDVQDATVQTYREGSGTGVLGGAPPVYTRVSLGYRGDTIVPVSATLDGSGHVVQAVVYDEQDGAYQTYTATFNAKGAIVGSYSRTPLGYVGDTIVPMSVTLDNAGHVLQAAVYDKQDGTVQSYRAGTTPTYDRVALGYKGDTIVPFTPNSLLYGLTKLRSALQLG